MTNQPPQWFKDFANEMISFKTNQEKFNANQEKFNSEIKSSIQGINTRIDNLVNKNNLSE